MSGHLYSKDPSVAPPGEFETVKAWLESMPPYTILIHEYDDGMVVPLTAEQILWGMEMQEHLLKMFKKIGIINE